MHEMMPPRRPSSYSSRYYHYHYQSPPPLGRFDSPPLPTHHHHNPPPPPLGRVNSPPPTLHSGYNYSPPPHVPHHQNTPPPLSRVNSPPSYGYNNQSPPPLLRRRPNSPPLIPNSIRYLQPQPPPLVRFNSPPYDQNPPPPLGRFNSPPRNHHSRYHNQNPPPPLGRVNSPPPPPYSRYNHSPPPLLRRLNSPPLIPNSIRYPQPQPPPLVRFNSPPHNQNPPPPPLGRFNSPPSKVPLYFRPRRPSRSLLLLDRYLPHEFYRRHVDRTARNLSPVAGGRGRHSRRTRRSPSASQSPCPRSPGRRRTTRTPASQPLNPISPRRRSAGRTPASKPPNPRSPGRRPSSRTPASKPRNLRSPGRRPTRRTPDVQEVRQACQSQRQDERSIRGASFVDDASSTAEGVRSRKLQKSLSRKRTHFKKLAVTDDQEKEKPGQASHIHQCTRGKKKAERQTDQISISDYVGSTTAGDEGYGEGKFQDLITSEGVDHEGSFLADSQDEGIRERGPFMLSLEMKNGPSTAEGDIMQVESQELVSSMRNEPDVPVLADSQEARQAQEINQSQPSPRMAKRQKDQTYTMDDASTSEGGEIKERKLQKFMSLEKNELEVAAVPKKSLMDSACVVFGEVGNTIAERVDHEGSFIADLQDKGIQERSDPSQGPDSPRRLCKKNSEMNNGPSTPGGDIMQEESQELMYSVSNELEAPVLADSHEGSQGKVCNQSQASPGKPKRRKDQVDSMEKASSTSEGGEMRERKLQKLMSSEKNELEAATVPVNYLKDSACVVLGELDNTIAPLALLAQRTSCFHDLADSCSLTISSLFDWPSTFDDVSSSGAGYWGNDETTVKVGNYFVDQKHSATMNAIINRYGDIAKDCRYTSTMFRSYAVQAVCEVVEGLQISLQQLSHDRLDKYSCFLKDAAEMGLTVKWLEERVDDVSNAIESLKEYKKIRDARKWNMGKIEGLKTDIGLLVTKKRKCENEIEGLKCALEEAWLEVRKKKSAIDDIKSLCKVIPKRLLDGLY